MMKARKAPVEIAGYVNRFVLVVDIHERSFRLRWMSVINENYGDDEFLPWAGDSGIDSCPF